MLAPWCEAEVSEPMIGRLGLRSLDLWREQLPDTPFNGSLVVAHARDRADFERFAKMTTGHRRLDARGLGELEPSLEGRFRDALFFPARAMSSRAACCRNCTSASSPPAAPSSSTATSTADDLDGIVIDCRGLAARDAQPSCAASRAR